ncbi:MBL fold metallo-hydrolase [Pseudomonas sp. LRF_L74]|uniref:MBL fold metallo-hydrolase n=1 Tax=Pseudomonas sp. LRF_L74 TaxID=3369422 RepID=UPI003F61A95A
MMQSRMIGDIKVTRILEYAGPTHDPAFLFPQLDSAVLAEHSELMAPNHWVPHMNRLIVTIQFWIVHVGSNIVVIDTGVGNFKPRPGIARMNMLNGLVREWMIAAGASPEKVTHVVITHLHADHVGWNTTWQDGRWVPTFPNATYHLPKDDFDFCDQGKNREPGVIDVFGEAFFDSVMPIVDAGLARMMVPGQEIADCLVVEPAPGHSPGQVTFRVRSKGEEGIFCGDILHSPVQIVRPEVNSGYCIWEDTARKTRLAFLNAAADREALIMPVHFGEPHCGYIRRQGDSFRFEPASW